MKIVKESIDFSNKLFEIGEANIAYEWEFLGLSGNTWAYSFETEDGDHYMVAINIKEYGADTAKVDFGIYEEDNHLTNKITNKGRILKILSTVVETIIHFLITNYEHGHNYNILIQAAKEKDADDRRFKIYLQFVEKQIHQLFKNAKVNIIDIDTEGDEKLFNKGIFVENIFDNIDNNELRKYWKHN